VLSDVTDAFVPALARAEPGRSCPASDPFDPFDSPGRTILIAEEDLTLGVNIGVPPPGCCIASSDALRKGERKGAKECGARWSKHQVNPKRQCVHLLLQAYLTCTIDPKISSSTPSGNMIVLKAWRRLRKKHPDQELENENLMINKSAHSGDVGLELRQSSGKELLLMLADVTEGKNLLDTIDLQILST
jgi:hypothetical protein